MILVLKFPIHTSEENVKDINVVEIDSIHSSEDEVSGNICPDVLIYNSYPYWKFQFVPVQRMSKTLSEKILKMQLMLLPFIPVKRKSQNLSLTLSKRLFWNAVELVKDIISAPINSNSNEESSDFDAVI